MKPQPALAWDAFPANMALNAVEQIQEHIKSVTLASLKQAAIQMINEEIDNTLADLKGIKGGLITDWEDYLKGIPERETTAFMNDYLSSITQGRNSSHYRSVPVSQSIPKATKTSAAYEGFGAQSALQFALIQRAQAQEDENTDFDTENYSEYLDSIGRSVIDDDDSMDITYQKNFGSMFSDNDFSDLNNYLAGDNNPWIFSVKLAALKEETEKEKTLEQQSKTASTGYSPVIDENGLTIQAASTLEALQNKAKVLWMESLAQAENLPEVVSSVVIEAIKRSINQGVGALKDRAQRELSNVRRQIIDQTRRSAQEVGPQAVFGNQTFYEQSQSD